MNGGLLALASLCVGAFLCAVYDVFRLFRLVREQNGVALFLSDLLFCIIASLCMTVLFFNLSFGRMRAFAFVFALIGFLIWRSTVGRVVMLLMKKLLAILKKLLNSIKTRLRVIISPVIGWINKIKEGVKARFKRKENENVADQESKA